LKTNVNVPKESNKQNKLQKNLFFVEILEVTDEKSRIRSRIRSGIGCVNQVTGSKDPDPYQNVTDPEHWVKERTEIKGIQLAQRKKQLEKAKNSKILFCKC
jgi:hypothetical protein